MLLHNCNISLHLILAISMAWLAVSTSTLRWVIVLGIECCATIVSIAKTASPAVTITITFLHTLSCVSCWTTVRDTEHCEPHCNCYESNYYSLHNPLHWIRVVRNFWFCYFYLCLPIYVGIYREVTPESELFFKFFQNWVSLRLMTSFQENKLLQ